MVLLDSLTCTLQSPALAEWAAVGTSPWPDGRSQGLVGSGSVCRIRLGMGSVSLRALPWPWGSFVASPMTQAVPQSACLQGMGELSGAGAPWQDLGMHRNLDKLEKWETASSDNLTRSHKAKCQVLHLAWDNS